MSWVQLKFTGEGNTPRNPTTLTESCPTRFESVSVLQVHPIPSLATVAVICITALIVRTTARLHHILESGFIARQKRRRRGIDWRGMVRYANSPPPREWRTG